MCCSNTIFLMNSLLWDLLFWDYNYSTSNCRENYLFLYKQVIIRMKVSKDIVPRHYNVIKNVKLVLIKITALALCIGLIRNILKYLCLSAHGP